MAAIRVVDSVVWHEPRGYSAARIVEALFPSISKAHIHAAAASGFDHAEAIPKDLHGDDERARWGRRSLSVGDSP